MGPVDDPIRLRDQAAAEALSGGFTAARADEQLHINLKQQWALDSIGINPLEPPALPIALDPVYQRFVESTTFENNRYTVRLPWRTMPALLPRNEGLARGCLQS